MPVRFLCTHFGVSRSGYYFWKSNSSSCHKAHEALDRLIKEEFNKSQKTYGSPRIYHSLKSHGISCCLNTVASRMKVLGLKVNTKNKFVVKTTDSNHTNPIAPRLFKTEEALPERPNEVWAGDITYIKIDSCFYYLSVVLDIFNREVIGWSIDDSLRVEGVMKALKNAILVQGVDAQVIFHSDRGSQYASKQFRSLLTQSAFIPSMSRKGNCYDNAYVESFFKTLKSDLRNMKIVLTKGTIVSELFKYIEIWYNRKRIHSSLDYISPIEFKQKAVH